MYFEVTNTPENRKQQRNNDAENREETYTLALIPFSATPTITFEDVSIGQKSVKTLNISNPKSTAAHVVIQKRADDLNLEFTWCECTIPPYKTAELEISWLPKSVIAQRTTVQVADGRKGRYDVVVVCKSIKKGPNSKGIDRKKINKPKLKKSPLKPKSPKHFVTKFFDNAKENDKVFKVLQENVSTNAHFKQKSPVVVNERKANIFNNSNISFDISDYDVRRETYFISKAVEKENNLPYEYTPVKRKNDSKNRRVHDLSVLSAIENMGFSPLKTYNKYVKKDLNETTTKITHETHIIEESVYYINSIDSEVNFKNDTTHPIIDLINSSNSSTEHKEILKTPHIFVIPQPMQDKPSHSVPKNLYETFNTNILLTPNQKTDEPINLFNPKRCSTEKKVLNFTSSSDFEASQLTPKILIQDMSPNTTFKRLSSETYTKGDSPIVPLDPESNQYLQSSPYSLDDSPVKIHFPYSAQNLMMNDNMKGYNERINLRNTIRDKNNFNTVKSVIEANMWQQTPPIRSVSPTPLSSIPEESSAILAETTYEVSKKTHYDTFILNQTYEESQNMTKTLPKTGWSKTKPTNVVPKIKKTQILKSNSCYSDYSIDVYSMASIVDPFLASSGLYDEEAFSRLETEFKRWLNYLLTPPSDLDTKPDVDIGKAWVENRSKTVPLAPTNEQMSLKYHTSHRLASLRKAGDALIKTTQMSQVFLKVSCQVEKKILAIRTDRNLHLDIGLQKTILSILLCYNPLWLRIGLEVLYNRVIPLASNSDVGGLSEFIVENMFKNTSITSKHLLVQPAYAETLKKFTLKKFLFLVYFLDQAKEKKMIFHDPCLFCRNAQFKESKLMLFEFAKDVLSGIGDITKHLRPTGYIVTHKQTHLNEFKYAVHNLAVDLKDGVRLTRLMEIILMKEGLLNGLRTPAISRLQKVHNVQIALTALASANFNIVGDIAAKDIADGHREKTLSLLWQLINKFRAPLFENAAILIQKWWRKNYLKIWIRDRIAYKKTIRLSRAAVTIQSWWKGIISRRRVEVERKVKVQACTIIQKNMKMLIERRRFQKLLRTVLYIQNRYRSKIAICKAKLILDNLKKNRSATVIQTWYRKLKNRQYLELNNTDRPAYLSKKNSAITIQIWYRKCVLKSQNKDKPMYLLKRSSAITIQRWYRKVKLNEYLRSQNSDRPAYLLLRSSVITIQQYYRKMIEYQYRKSQNQDRAKFLMQRSSAIVIQKWYRKIMLNEELKLKNTDRIDFIEIRSCVIVIQMWYRKVKLYQSLKEQNLDRPAFMLKKKSVLTIQRWYRRTMLRAQNEDRPSFLLKRQSVIIIQSWYRKIIMQRYMKSQNTDRPIFLKQKESAIAIQQWYRKVMLYRMLKSQNQDRDRYLSMRGAAIKIQIWYRKMSSKSKNEDRMRFLIVKSSTVTIQQWFRKKLLLQELESKNTDRSIFISKRNSAIKIQSWYRKIKVYRMLKAQNTDRSMFLLQKSSVIIIQNWYRKIITYRYLKSLNTERTEFLLKRNSTIVIQSWYRKIKMDLYLRTQNEDRPRFLLQKNSATIVQRWYRETMRKSQNVDRPAFLLKKNSATVIQRWYRKMLLNRYLESLNFERPLFLLQKKSAITIQRGFRKYKLYQYLKSQNTDRSSFILKKNATIQIQSWYRMVLMIRYLQYINEDRPKFLLQKSSVVIIQRWYRKKMMHRYLESHNKDRPLFLIKRTMSIKIQIWYRKIKAVEEFNRNNIDRITFLRLKYSAIKIQQWYRRIILERVLALNNIERDLYLVMRCSAVVLQKWFRKLKAKRDFEANNMDRFMFLQKKYAAITIQNMYRATVVMKHERYHYLMLKITTIRMQRLYRSSFYTRLVREHYLCMKYSTIVIQRRFRAYLLMKKCRCEYVQKINSAITIQRFYRNYLLTQNIRNHYLRLRLTTIYLQRMVRQKHLMIEARESYLKKIRSTLIIQRFYRAFCVVRYERIEYLRIRSAAVVLQQKFRANQLMKKQRKRYLTLRKICVIIQIRYKKKFAIRRQIIEHERTKEVLRAQMDAEEKKIQELKYKAALKIQSYWRGYELRKRQDDNSKVKQLRKKWQKGGLNSKQLTLAERNDDALDVLIRFKDIASVIRAFETLNFVTNVYPMMYSAENVKSVTRSLTIYMGATNRAVSVLETLHPGIAIFINLTRYAPTARHAFNVAYLNTLLLLMTRWCDKDNNLSCSLCTLFWLYGKYDDIKEDVARFLKLEDSYKIICKVRCLIIRKRKMDNHKRSSINLNGSMHGTPVKNNKNPHVRYPMLEPDFGILNPAKVRVFQNDLDGINAVFDRFDLPLNVITDVKSPTTDKSRSRTTLRNLIFDK